ncbi:MAG: ATP-dependent RNA helicase HrpA [Thermodesulfobacteriota bacterium]
MIKTAYRLAGQALRADRLYALRRLSLMKGRTRSLSGPAMEKELTRLVERLERSAALRASRHDRFPLLPSDPALPIAASQDRIITAIQKHPVVIISGATGSGKTTQIPRYCVAAGCGKDGRIGCTQPRRIAAVSVAARIAEELGPAPSPLVGHKIRFSDTVSDDHLIKVMTDGILLAEAHQDRFLNEYDAIVVDEAHERSLNIDFILGILKQVLGKRADLRVVITSATIDTEKFSKAFGDAPVIEVSGRMYPVEIQYAPPETEPGESDSRTYVEQAVAAVETICRRHRSGDILVFMPTAQDIKESCEMIEGRRLQATTVMPLFARLSGADQAAVFTRPPGRKIIVATNIAETSITIPGIRYVVDTGLARISYYNPRTRTTSLSVRPVSRSSCQQRAGRCGRVENGVCVRLYEEKDFNSRPLFTPPEILRANLAEVILRMTALKLGTPDTFPFVDRPVDKSVRDGYDTLMELGAIAAAGRRSGAWRLTDTGRLMAKIPVDPRLARILIEAAENRCLEAAMVVVSALSMQDPRETPAEKEKEARAMHATFAHPASDFITLLNIWEACRDKGTAQLKRFCRDHFLSFRRMREWRDLHAQIGEIAKEHGLAEAGAAAIERHRDPDGFYAAFHRSLLCGYLSNIAEKKEKNIYNAAGGKTVMIFPGSALFNAEPTMIVAAELVETSRLYARTVAAIDRKWLLPLAGDLCRRTYLNPRWRKSREEVVADCRTTLFGLVIDFQESVSYGRVDPATASDIFIRSALVNGDVKQALPFMAHNARLLEEGADIENRLRRKTFLVADDDLFAFYRQRLDTGVYSMRTLKNRMAENGDDFLKMSRSDVLKKEPDAVELARFPDTIRLGRERFACLYAFDPAREDDGLTVSIPAPLVPDVDPEYLDWLVPGLLPEKIAALVKGLPKEYRRRLVPINRTVETITAEMPQKKQPLLSALSLFIRKRFGVEIPAAAWQPEKLPDYLKTRIAITDETRREIGASRNPDILRQSFDAGMSADELAPLKRQWEKTGCRTWDFPDLPEEIAVKGKRKTICVYPGIEDRGDHVDLRIFESRQRALAAHLQGVKRLLLMSLSREVRYLDQDLALSGKAAFGAVLLGGAKVLEARMKQKVIDDLLAVDIRTQTDFEAYVARVPQQLYESAHRLKTAAEAVIVAYHEARRQMDVLAASLKAGSGTGLILKVITDALAALVPETFVAIYDMAAMERLGCYIQAAVIRARRAADNPGGDRKKAGKAAWAKAELDRLVAGLSSDTSDDKRRAVESFFWMVEEYKVSVFAQELKTAFPVSEKRLREKIREIDAMV